MVTPSRSAMSTSRSRGESRKAPKRVASPCARAITPSTRSKIPPARIRSPPVANQPRPKAAAATSEIRQPTTVRRFGLRRRRKRKGSTAFTMASSWWPSFALITPRLPRSARLRPAAFPGLPGLLLDREGHGLAHDVGQRRKLARELLRGEVPPAADQPPVQPQALLRLAIHRWSLPDRAQKR